MELRTGEGTEPKPWFFEVRIERGMGVKRKETHVKTKRKHQRNTLSETCRIINYIQRRERFKKEAKQIFQKFVKDTLNYSFGTASLIQRRSNLPTLPMRFLFSDDTINEKSKSELVWKKVGNITNYNDIISTLYSSEYREKVKWVIEQLNEKEV